MNDTQKMDINDKPYLDRLEALVTALLEMNFDGAAGIWQFELDLLEVQREIQAAITLCKQKMRRREATLDQLNSLRQARWHARRLGDALAWVLLDNDRKIIFSLSENESVSVPTDEHGNRGTVAIAQGLADQGWGFPLLHDITDVLRVGDVSFVRFDRPPTTVEVKTRLVDENPMPDGRTAVTYQVTVLAAEGRENISSIVVPSNEQPIGFVPNPRALRQLQRLGRAKAHQESQEGVLNTGGGDERPSIITTVINRHRGHWDLVSEMIKTAYRTGFASAAPEPPFVYAAFYNQNGVSPADVTSAPLIEGVKDSQFLMKSGGNSLYITSIPSSPERRPALYLPYFLYPIPVEQIVDLLHGRLLLVVFHNMGRTAAALATAGVTLDIQDGRKGTTRGAITLSANFEHDDGKQRFEWNGFHHYVEQVVNEFDSSELLIDIATKLCDEAGRNFGNVRAHYAMIRESRQSGSVAPTIEP
ncbi:hypothetical protein ABZS66_35795 [Dactylosporangium sp. NPDC005572]|uniref:hypothetical protein n=1 Tax=Dactylosporangium sp. NPDC005572 TaxID=3156889 RepID=UPI0033A013FC